MNTEKLRRLWYLSTVPTHSPQSLEELHLLVKEAVVSLVLSGEGICGECVYFKGYDDFTHSPCNACDNYKNFELTMNKK